MKKLKERKSTKKLELKERLKNNKAITLIALIVTIIVLLILAGVSIATLTGDNGLLTKAQEAKEATEEAGQKDLAGINQLLMYMEGEVGEQYDAEKGVNKPALLTGMKAIKFNNPTADTKGSVNTDVTEGWYNYEAKEWANAQTEDGSMWVWIPRFAYKITYYTDATKVNESTEKTKYGSIDVKFLIGETDQYYNETTGKLDTAIRAKTANDEIDATKNYVVHPAFTDESSSELNYANGGWDKELTGIWVSKFEAGYASGNNSAPVKASSIKYTQASVWANSAETGGEDGNLPARNWLDGVYGKQEGTGHTWLNGEVAIKYPTFQGKTYSMNYININDAFNITRALTESGNIYGLSIDTDSHLMKNSEWGAVAYLSQSQYGLNGTNVYVNNANLNNSTESVYAVTGMCSAESADKGAVETTIEKINSIEGNTPQDNLYTWDQLNGQKASSTGTIYGVYDMSGGTWERTAGYVANGNRNLKTYGRSFTYDGETLKTTSTKYTTIYPHSSNDKSGASTDIIETLNKENYDLNNRIYGDGIRETSIQGTSNESWYSDHSFFPALDSPFVMRGGNYIVGSDAGLFAFRRTDGYSNYSNGFRAVLCAQ